MRKPDAGASPNPDPGPIEPYLDALAREDDPDAAALGQCVLRIEEAAPTLRSLLARAADGVSLSDDEATLLFRGLHVLGAARDRESFQPLLRLLRRPNDEIDDLLGDTVTATLPRIAAGLFDGDVDSLFACIVDRRLDEFIRSSLFDAATFLTWDGKIDRDRMRLFLVDYDEQRLGEDEDYAWVSWVTSIALLGLREFAPLAEAAFDQGRLPDRVIELQHFDADLSGAERAPDDISRFRRANMGYIDDIVEALAWTLSPDAGDLTPFREPPSMPIRNPMRNVGRNDPCPCGSGKKAKKCCLANG